MPDLNFTYTTTDDSVITMSANSVYNFDFTINVLTGDIANNKLTCTISGVPAKVTITPASLLVGQILGGVFTINTDSIPVGYDTMTFTRTCSALGTQTNKLILHIVPPVDNAPKLAGTYDGCSDFCQPNITYNYNSVVSTVAGIPYEIRISNMRDIGSGFIVNGWVSQTAISIPLQTTFGYTVCGSGYYDLVSNTGSSYYEMIINDTLVSGLDTQVCIVHIQPH